MKTCVGPLKIIHVIEFKQDDTEEDDEFRYQVKLNTPEGAAAAIGFRSAKITMFHDPSEVELSEYNRESRKVNTQSNTSSNSSSSNMYDDQDERVATKGKKKNGR